MDEGSFYFVLKHHGPSYPINTPVRPELRISGPLSGSVGTCRPALSGC